MAKRPLLLDIIIRSKECVLKNHGWIERFLGSVCEELNKKLLRNSFLHWNEARLAPGSAVQLYRDIFNYSFTEQLGKA